MDEAHFDNDRDFFAKKFWGVVKVDSLQGFMDSTTMSSEVFQLKKQPVHLGLGAKVTVQEPFDGSMEWYQNYGARNASDGTEGRLVSLHRFSSSWGTWEMHPKGEELVVCIDGEITLHQERDGEVHTVVLKPGEAVINPKGVWHTADVERESSALFITAGVGTEIRKR